MNYLKKLYFESRSLRSHVRTYLCRLDLSFIELWTISPESIFAERETETGAGDAADAEAAFSLSVALTLLFTLL